MATKDYFKLTSILWCWIFRINHFQTLSASVRYFVVGKVFFGGQSFDPCELAIDVAYSRALTDHFSLAFALRYIHSDLTGCNIVGGTESEVGKSIAGDLALYQFNEFSVFQKDARLAFGLNISNVGGKIAYTANQPPGVTSEGLVFYWDKHFVS